MTPRVYRAAGAAALALLAAAATVRGQASPSSPGTAPAAPAPQVDPAAPQFEDELAVSWILVPVLVKRNGGKGGYLQDLEREDFELRVRGRVVRFADFEQRGEAPWSLVFLQDLSGSMGVGGRFEASLEAIRYFFDRARPGDEYALASFASDTTAVDVPFTEELEPLREAIGRWEPWGKTALHDAVAWLPDISGSSRNVKRAAVLITDGVDNASRIGPSEARELVRRAELPVYVLGLESGDPLAVDRKGQEVYQYADVLNLLALMTGGKYFPIQGPNDVKEACATIADELRYQYVLGFDTLATGDVEWQPITVIVKRKDIKVVARKGYRGTTPKP